jgi:hypothetical protein
MFITKTIQKAWMKTINHVPNSSKTSTWMYKNKIENISFHNLKK